MTLSPALAALLLTAFAGLSTGIGSTIAYFIKKPKMIYLSFALGFSGGVMIYVSFVELFPQGIVALGEPLGILIFFLGMAFIALIDFFLPEIENPHHPVDEGCVAEECADDKPSPTGLKGKAKAELMKMGTLTAVAIGIHNFPEGLATFGAALADIKLGAVIAIAIAIHNIPEGISVSLPIYYATGSKKRAFTISFLSGVAEPVGALIGYAILLPFLSDQLIGGLLIFIAGVMVYISLDEILPTAHHYGHGHLVISGVILGMIVMGISLILL
jgi:ZIP family zinc transporter